MELGGKDQNVRVVSPAGVSIHLNVYIPSLFSCGVASIACQPSNSFLEHGISGLLHQMSFHTWKFLCRWERNTNEYISMINIHLFLELFLLVRECQQRTRYSEIT